MTRTLKRLGAVLGFPEPLYLFVFTHFRTQNSFALLLEMLYPAMLRASSASSAIDRW